jgi:hypothetical protein
MNKKENDTTVLLEMMVLPTVRNSLFYCTMHYMYLVILILKVNVNSLLRS